MKEKISQLKEKLIQFLNNFYSFIDRIGKRNFILAICILFTLVITGLYVTFSLYTSSDGLSVLDGIKTYKFILGADNVENAVTIAAGTSKNVAITVSNHDKIKLKYGIYYTSSDDLTDVDLGYKRDTEYLPNGLIDTNEDYVVMIQIDNHAGSDITISFGIIYGIETGGDLVLGEQQHWLEKKWNFPLSEVEVGSYVAYQGNNGCTGASCSGQNANYVSDSDMGYCYEDTYKYTKNGWRVGYIKDESAYLISAGSVDCLCTNSDGTFSNSSCSSYETTSETPEHINNLNTYALKYCNPKYSYQGLCNLNTAHSINATDFKNITGNNLSADSCFSSADDTNCGYNNDLIDNGGHYWYATPYKVSYNKTLYWSADVRFVSNYATTIINIGVRPVLRLDSSVVVTSGTGTYEDPYQIKGKDYLSGYVSKLYHDGSSINTVYIGGDTSNPTVSLNATQGIMLDNNGEYRYYGADPNNYVSFNNELWRIISVSNVKSSASDEYGEVRVKLIRDEILGYYSWDSSESTDNSGQGYNKWETADLNLELNDTYYNQKSGTCYNGQNNASTTCDFTSIGLNATARSMISDALYYLGSIVDVAKNNYANNIYDEERGSYVYENNLTQWVGNVGLMYPSDYVYATDLSLCTNPAGWGGDTMGYNSTNNCKNNDWLLMPEKSYAQWTIIPFGWNNGNAFHINPTGYVSGNNTGYGQVIRPVVYLNSNVIVTGGDGSPTNPYTISVES